MAVIAAESLELALPDEAATARLAARVAVRARAGDVIGLSGGLGAGKTAFARAFIRALPGGAAIGEVPSPTFTLVQVYELDRATVWHVDLYRLTRPEEAWELGLEEAFATAIALIEWPERLGDALPPDRLEVALSAGTGDGARRARIRGFGAWRGRVAGLERDG